MKKRDKANVERLGVLAAWMIAAAFALSFIDGVRWPFPSSSDQPAAAAQRKVLDPGDAVVGRVEVLNSTARDGMAQAAMEQLRADGFDVVYIANADLPEPADSSVVLDRVGDLELARAVAERLGIDRVRSEPDSTALVDVTVLIGLDWEPGR